MKHFLQADATRLPFADKSVAMVLGSPPYMDARSYGIQAQRGCFEWIDFMLACTHEAVRVCKGLVIWVVGGVTRKKCYWPGCEGLLYEWWKQGGQCWRPAFFHRVGIPGSGGKQWLRADTEYCLAFKGEGDLPWSDNTACGHKPKWAPGGEMSYRLANGQRVNQWGGRPGRRITGGVGERINNKAGDCPSHVFKKVRRCTRGNAGGDTIQEDAYIPPKLANPGNVVKVSVGGGRMGDNRASLNEAPFPEKLAEFFILGWCPPGGIVLDVFSGSGTTVAVAAKHGRHGIGCDIRLSQCDLGRRRCQELQPVLF